MNGHIVPQINIAPIIFIIVINAIQVIIPIVIVKIVKKRNRKK